MPQLEQQAELLKVDIKEWKNNVWPVLKGEKLTKVDFSFLKLDFGNFNNADLTGSSFRGSYLVMCEFKGTKIGNADFSNANLECVDLSNASFGDNELPNLKGATVRYTSMTGKCWDRYFELCPKDQLPKNVELVKTDSERKIWWEK